MNICIFPGTFNPIHFGHIKMALIVLEKYNFDKIIFIPSYIPPHKQINSNLAEHRFNMVKLAVDTNPKFEISDIEYQAENKSYTFITVNKIKEKYHVKDKLNIIIGTDAFINVKTWYKADELKNLVHFLVFPRGNDLIKENEFKDWSYELIDTEKLDISSTELREKHKGETLKEVEEYIKNNELYN